MKNFYYIAWLFMYLAYIDIIYIYIYYTPQNQLVRQVITGLFDTRNNAITGQNSLQTAINQTN